MEDQILYRPPVEPGSQTSPDQTSIEEKAHGTAASGRSFGRSASMRFWRRLRRWEARAGGHSTATEFAGETLVVPKSFDAPSSDMGEVESRIRAALSAGELRGPDGRLTRWDVLDSAVAARAASLGEGLFPTGRAGRLPEPIPQLGALFF